MARAIEDAAVAVRGVFAQADVGDDRELVAHRKPNRAQRLLDDAVIGPCPGPLAVLAIRQPEEEDRSDTGPHELQGVLGQRGPR